MRLHLLRAEAPEPHIASQRAEKRRQQQIDARYVFRGRIRAGVQILQRARKPSKRVLG